MSDMKEKKKDGRSGEIKIMTKSLQLGSFGI